MESSTTTILQLSHQFSFLPPKLRRRRGRSIMDSSPFRPWKQMISQPTRFYCQKMYVPEQSYNPEAYEELMEFLGTHSLNDGDKFCADLMRESLRHKSLALRILEVRSAYCKNDFEWDNLKRLASKMVDESNTRIMRDYVLEHVERDK
ncbi:chaperonin-like RBCX protein 1, chloroplastic isoform X3 [Camellia sinensis]|uniref:chaperonin-like RBCX protein 1, chloroplastic isoform X3 n=1 Tax=Camellia sinensis TaxID=4442 RepID=UPI0010364A96|nr:chaperonin-like RBCX protein 1, chloroplastic isoform X3 [Camellia sinensis]